MQRWKKILIRSRLGTQKIGHNYLATFFEGCNCRFFWHRKSTLLETKTLASARNFLGRWAKRSTILFCVERNPIYQCPLQVSEPFDDGDFWLWLRLLYTRGLSIEVFLGKRYQSLLLPAQFLSICVGMLREVAKIVKVFFYKSNLENLKIAIDIFNPFTCFFKLLRCRSCVGRIEWLAETAASQTAGRDQQSKGRWEQWRGWRIDIWWPPPTRRKKIGPRG